MKNTYIILFLIFHINCNYWFPEVNGCDEGDWANGFAGSGDVPIMDFYLCSERYYRVHYKGEEEFEWSKEFTACQPIGKGKEIDGIAISGGLIYEGSVKDKGWLGNVSLYNISDSSKGYCGWQSYSLYLIAIDGKDYYRTAYNASIDSSNENIVAQRTIFNLFRIKKDFSYEKEIEISNGPMANISIILLNPNDINFEGKIKIKVESSKIKDDNYNRLISDKLKFHLNKIIDFDFDKMNNFIEEKFLKDGLRNGTVTINSKWIQNCIEIDSGVKINADYHSYRGGFRIIIHLNDDNIELFLKIKNILKTLFKFLGKKIPEELLNDLNSFKKIEPVINELDINSIIAETIILYTILSNFIVY